MRNIYILAFLLILTILLSIKVTKRATNLMVEGDASAEMVLSHTLSKSNELFSKDWIYPREIQLFLQLIFAPLFKVISDWSQIRFIGTLILHFLLLLSFTFMMKKANQDIYSILLGCILLLLPYCVVYGRIALYQVMYLPNIIISFFTVGLLFSVIKSYRQSKKIICVIYLLVLFAFIFFISMTSIRYIAEILFPLILVCLFSAFVKNDFLINENIHDTILWYISLLGIVIAGFAGYFFGKNTIMQTYKIGDSANINLTIRRSFNTSIWKCILHQFGFRTGVSVISIIGIFSLAGLFVAFYIFYSSIMSFKEKSLSISDVILRRMSIASFLIVVLEMCLLDGIEITPRYFISSSIWMIPLLCSYLKDYLFQNKLRPDKCFYFLCVIIMAINGLLNASFFLNPDEIAKQPYEGLPYTNPNMVKDLKRSIEFITDNNYEFGYATYWEATTITEKTNGLPVGGFTVEGNKLVPAMMLTLRSYATYPAEKVFLLMDVTNAQYFPNFEVPFEWEEVYRDTKYVIYDIVDYDQMRIYLDSNR